MQVLQNIIQDFIVYRFFYLYRLNSTNIPTLDKGHKKAKSKAGSPHMFESPREAEGGKAWEIGENGESGESDGNQCRI